jgi:D-serine deaminase-like pyridoxal phosphate-dependent protein
VSIAVGSWGGPSQAHPAMPKLTDLTTPFALIDGQIMRRNIAAMQEAMVSIGASLRPHFKTHRTMAIAQLQRDAGASGVTVATLRQLAAVGRDLGPVLVSSAVHVDGSVGPDLQAALAGPGVTFAVESGESIRLLRSALGPELTADVMIEVEAGCLRSGAAPSECGDLARAASRLGFRVTGLFSYPGQAYLPGRAQEASREELSALALGASVLSRAGFDPEHVSAGSTPTMRFAAPGVATEYRPGTYVFGDRQQLGLGAMDRPQLALTVIATVVAIHGDRLVLDAGGKALGRDAPSWLPGFGQLADPSEAPITRLYDHHSVVDSYRGQVVSVGDRLAILPNNANSVMALLRSAWLSDDGELAEEIAPLPDR